MRKYLAIIWAGLLSIGIAWFWFAMQEDVDLLASIILKLPLTVWAFWTYFLLADRRVERRDDRDL